MCARALLCFVRLLRGLALTVEIPEVIGYQIKLNNESVCTHKWAGRLSGWLVTVANYQHLLVPHWCQSWPDTALLAETYVVVTQLAPCKRGRVAMATDVFVTLDVQLTGARRGGVGMQVVVSADILVLNESVSFTREAELAGSASTAIVPVRALPDF